MKVGDEAEVHVPGIADPVPAKVSLISPALDPGSTTVEVWLKIDNKAGKLKVGTPVKASDHRPDRREGVEVPASAVLTAQDGSKSVMVVGADGTAHRKPVTLGSPMAKMCRSPAASPPPTWSSPAAPTASMKAPRSRSARRKRTMKPSRRQARPERTD